MFRLFQLSVFIYSVLHLNVVFAERVSVIVSIPPQKYLVEKLGGDHLDVYSLLKPGDSPELFELTPGKAKQLSMASAYLKIGLGIESRWLQVIRQQNKNIKVIECCSQYQNEARDVHVWTNPRIVKLIAGQVMAELVKLDPVNRADYKKNYKELVYSLDTLDADIRHLLDNKRTEYILVSHPSLTYFTDEYGLHQLSVESHGNEIGPRKLMEIISKAKSENIRIIFSQSQFKNAGIKVVAKELNAEIVDFNPLAENYIANLRDIARLVAQAVR